MPRELLGRRPGATPATAQASAVPVRDVAVVGAGLGGALIARILAGAGFDVVLIDRGQHPRFAVGESSTPLAGLCLERLAQRYGLDDLRSLSTHGRWMRSLPELQRGLKRGFTFYRHTPGRPYTNSRHNENRLLVAASPNDEVADAHWLRADVDEYLTLRAVADGTRYLPNTELAAVAEDEDVVRLELRSEGGSSEVTARFVVDASGRAAAVARRLGARDATDELRTHSGFVGSHFEGVQPFDDVARANGAVLTEGPYLDEWSAVHHLLDEGWLYSLRFDDGRVSAGLLMEGAEPDLEVDGEAVWGRVLQRYPSLEACFAGAKRVEPWLSATRVQHRLSRPHGRRWACLPHAYCFVDPWFSTGIAWTLLGVERLAGLVLEALESGRGRPHQANLDRYGALLHAEASQIDTLVASAYRARCDFRLSAAHAMLYFAAVSWAESVQRLKPAGDDAWQGFLGVGDSVLERLPEDALARLNEIAIAREGVRRTDTVTDFEEWARTVISPRNVAGLANPGHQNLYPVDLADLVQSASRLDLTREEVEAALPRLRGFSPSAARPEKSV